MKLLILITFLAILTSCATADYHLDLSAGPHSYSEYYVDMDMEQMLSLATGKTVTINSGDKRKISTSGTGFRIGISESTKYIISKIGYSWSTLDPFTYEFDIDGDSLVSTTSTKVSGLYVSMGFRIPYIVPYISMRSLSMVTSSTYSGTAAETPSMGASSEGSFFGYGVDLEIPIGDKYVVYGGYSTESPLVRSTYEPEVDYESIHFGLRYFLGTIEGWSPKKSK